MFNNFLFKKQIEIISTFTFNYLSLNIFIKISNQRRARANLLCAELWSQFSKKFLDFLQS